MTNELYDFFNGVADSILDRVSGMGIPHPDEYREYLVNVLWSIMQDCGMTEETFEVDEKSLAEEIASAYWMEAEEA